MDRRTSTLTLSSTTSAAARPTSESNLAVGSTVAELDSGLPELTPTLLELGVSPFAGALKRTEVQRLEVTARLSLVETGVGDSTRRPQTLGGRAVQRLSVLLGKAEK
jgi:hypothetical protein